MLSSLVLHLLWSMTTELHYEVDISTRTIASSNTANCHPRINGLFAGAAKRPCYSTDFEDFSASPHGKAETA